MSGYVWSCVDCGRPLRNKRAAAVNHPGTVRHVAKGLCRTCYDAVRYADVRAARAAAAAADSTHPWITPEQHRHNMAGYEAWLDDRRKRGVPADGYHVEEEPGFTQLRLTEKGRGRTPRMRLLARLERERAEVARLTRAKEARDAAQAMGIPA